LAWIYWWSEFLILKMSFIAKKILNSGTSDLTWNSSNVPLGGNWSSVAFGSGKFVAVSGGENHVMAYSEDNAITWNIVNLETDRQNWISVTYGNGRFVAVGYERAAYSFDGINDYINIPFTINIRHLFYLLIINFIFNV
jgi:hypothetical protein